MKILNSPNNQNKKILKLMIISIILATGSLIVGLILLLINFSALNLPLNSKILLNIAFIIAVIFLVLPSLYHNFSKIIKFLDIVNDLQKQVKRIDRIRTELYQEKNKIAADFRQARQRLMQKFNLMSQNVQKKAIKKLEKHFAQKYAKNKRKFE